MSAKKIKQKKIVGYPEIKIWVRFKKTISLSSETDEGINRTFCSEKTYELPINVARDYISKGTAYLDPAKLSIEDLVQSYSKDFLKSFNPKKILDFLKVEASSFESEILKKITCPRCKVPALSRIVKKTFSEEFFCPVCKDILTKRFIGSHFPNWVISSTIHNFFQGKEASQVYKSLLNESTNRYLDFHELKSQETEQGITVETSIPKKGTLYDMLERSARKLSLFNTFMILLQDGLDCKELLVDDAFLKKTRPKAAKEEWKNASKSQRKKMRKGGFFYGILTMDKATRFILNVYIAQKRDKLNFLDAFMETRRILKEAPIIVIGDKLAAMIKGAEMTMPTDHTTHDFKKLKPWEKLDRMIYERRIRDLRDTLYKARKYSSVEVLINLVIIAEIGQNYLNPMDEALDYYSPAQKMGIPYPFDTVDEVTGKPTTHEFAWNWRLFLIWVDWVFEHIDEILMAGVE